MTLVGKVRPQVNERFQEATRIHRKKTVEIRNERSITMVLPRVPRIGRKMRKIQRVRPGSKSIKMWVPIHLQIDRKMRIVDMVDPKSKSTPILPPNPHRIRTSNRVDTRRTRTRMEMAILVLIVLKIRLLERLYPIDNSTRMMVPTALPMLPQIRVPERQPLRSMSIRVVVLL